MFLLSVLVLWAQDQSVLSYYQAADGKKGAELKTALFEIISPHEVQSYTPGVWNAINSYDIRPDGKIWDIYSGISNFTPKDDQDKGEEGQENEALTVSMPCLRVGLTRTPIRIITLRASIQCSPTCIISSPLTAMSTACAATIPMAK